MSPAPRQHTTSPPPAPRAKRNRLNVACNYCRSRKTRCDAQQPQCRACRLAGVPCVTVNRRQPDALVQRQAAGRPSETSQTPDSAPLLDQASQRESVIEESPIGELEPLRTSTGAASRFQGRLTIFQSHKHHARTLNSVETVVNWLNVALYRLGRSSGAALSASAAAELPSRIPLRLPTAPPLPSREACGCLLDSYLATVNLVYPVVDKRHIRDAFANAQSYGVERFVESYGLTLLMQIYLILLLGATCQPNIVQRPYLNELRDYCKTLQGHVLAHNSLDSIGAATLMTLQYIFQGQETAAWAMLIQSCAMVTTVGINPPLRSRLEERRLEGLEQSDRVWWSLYCLEKLLAFELGRSSHILELPKDTSRSFLPLGEIQNREDTAFMVVTSLAQTLHEISTSCIRVGEHEENSHDAEALRAAIAAKVATTGKCGALLYEWAGHLPPAYRPTSELLYIDRMSGLGVFASMRYHHAILTLCRNSLLLTEDAIQEATEVIAKDQPWEHFVRYGQTIAANAARRILTLTVEGADYAEKTIMPTFVISLHAAFVLHIYGIRHPKARMNAVDEVLIQHALNRIEELLGNATWDYSSIHLALRSFRDLYHHQPTNALQPNLNSTFEDHQPMREETSAGTSDMAAEMFAPSDRVLVNEGFVPVNRIPSVQEHPWGGHTDDIHNDFQIDELTYASAFADQIGWDWSAFSQLLSLPGSPGPV